MTLRRRAAGRLRDPAALLLTAAGLEQASTSAVAAHRAARVRAAVTDGVVADLCCGIGSDLRELSGAGLDVVGVDRDETHAWCARHNSGALVAVADVREIRLTGLAAAYVDPARRSGDRRGGSQPPLDWCTGLPMPQVAVKAAPGLDLEVVPPDWEVEFVAVGRELKEACLWSPGWASFPGARTATVLPAGADPAAASLTADPSTPSAPVRPPGRWVLDPSPAITRAGAVADLAILLGAWQVDPRIAFLCADTPMRTPFGRLLEVQASLPFAVKPLAAELRRLDIGPLDLRRRGLAGDVDDLRRRLRPRGNRPAVVLLTRVEDRPWALVCTEPGAPAAAS